MPSIYKKLFARYYDSFMYKTERGLYKKRKALIEPLRGRILEIGSGTGINYQFYSSDTELFALDPNQHMLDKAAIKAHERLNITYLNFGICDEGVKDHVDYESLDSIVCTLTLCSIPHPELAIERFRKLLKPDGKLIVLEHIHANNKFNKSVQNLLNPIWRSFSDGCNINRNTDQILLDGGFKPDESEYFVQSLRWVMGVYRYDG